eukprot:scaffold1085_cov90-Isochrysis_galbana.AAC.1
MGRWARQMSRGARAQVKARHTKLYSHRTRGGDEGRSTATPSPTLSLPTPPGLAHRPWLACEHSSVEGGARGDDLLEARVDVASRAGEGEGVGSYHAQGVGVCDSGEGIPPTGGEGGGGDRIGCVWTRSGGRR